MPMRFGGEEHFQAPPERVYALLTDLRRVAAMIPGLEAPEVDEQGILRCVTRPGFSFLRGTLRLAVRIEPEVHGRRATMLVTAEGIGTGMEVRSTVTLEDANGGTRLAWSAEVEQVRGLLAAVSPALIQAAAGRVMAAGWDQLRRQLSEAAAAGL